MRRFGTVLAASGAALLAALALGVAVGSAPLRWGEILSGEPTARWILAIRLPRVFFGAAVGASLALSGASLQALLKNPLADPFLLGISGGAAAGAAVGAALRVPAGFGPALAFLGAATSTLLVASLGRREGRIDLNRLLLAGVVANAFFSAVILLLLSFAPGAAARSMLFWMMGSLAEASRTRLFLLGGYLSAGLVALALFTRDLNLFQLGEDSARALGVAAERTKIGVFVASSLLTGAAVAFVGIVGFVGLIVPHLARLLVGGDMRRVLPTCALLGAALLASADALARSLLLPAELPIGAVTALLGVPFFLALLRRSA